MIKNVLDLTSQEAENFFLAEDRYFTFDLPKYFTFNTLLKKLSKKLKNKNLSDFYSQDKNNKPNKPENFEGVNYKLFNNKDGEYSWRLFQLIHPAIYVSLVYKITDKKHWDLIVKNLKEDTKVECLSLPVVKSEEYKTEKGKQIFTWWEKVEQKSIALSLEYAYIFHTDIIDCYGSIYTHSIAWALHTKSKAKKEKNNKKLIGNIIDEHLRQMSNGQTNGIPQGSILMDFIAEIVLKYVDKELSKKLNNIIDFKIIRYRDDYRIFVNDPETGKKIIKELSNVLADLGMRIRAEKTKFSSDIINSSIKEDKLFWKKRLEWMKTIDLEADHNITKTNAGNLQTELLIIRDFSLKYPNSGVLQKELERFYKKIYKLKSFNNVDALIGIITDIAFRNPRTYLFSLSILGKFISSLKDSQKKSFITKVQKKIKKLPNTEIVDLWLQRLTLKFDTTKKYQGRLSKVVSQKDQKVWNSEWLNKEIKNIIEKTSIINKEEIKTMDEYPDPDEIALFESKSQY